MAVLLSFIAFLDIDIHHLQSSRPPKSPHQEVAISSAQSVPSISLIPGLSPLLCNPPTLMHGTDEQRPWECTAARGPGDGDFVMERN